MPGDEQSLDPMLAAALRMIGRYGIRKTTLEDIAKEAGVSRSSLYRRYGSKAQIVDALNTALQLETFQRLMRDVPKGTPVREALVTILEVTHEHTSHRGMLPHLMVHEPETVARMFTESDEGTPSPYVFVAQSLGGFLQEQCPDVGRLRVEPAQAMEIIMRIMFTRVLGPTTTLGEPGDLVGMLLDGLISDEPEPRSGRRTRR